MSKSKNKKNPTKHYETKKSLKIYLEFILCWPSLVLGHAPSAVCMPYQAPLEKTNFSLLNG